MSPVSLVFQTIVAARQGLTYIICLCTHFSTVSIHSLLVALYSPEIERQNWNSKFGGDLNESLNLSDK